MATMWSEEGDEERTGEGETQAREWRVGRTCGSRIGAARAVILPWELMICARGPPGSACIKCLHLPRSRTVLGAGTHVPHAITGVESTVMHPRPSCDGDYVVTDSSCCGLELSRIWPHTGEELLLGTAAGYCLIY